MPRAVNSCNILQWVEKYFHLGYHASVLLRIKRKEFMIFDRINLRVEKAMLKGEIDALTSQNLMVMLHRVKARVEQALQNEGINASRGTTVKILLE
ncbi:hypothetical protein CHS0354_025872 [Potamilus streckersoni]|uniref:Uncharacterized protein n=1 Tax=Potamilus streckersoni TaxID=2493646 RepID=A0AAE0TJZ5_9BIVA|nr:hypothetical protein CHS0354_025872 [Potamilus streckersoni]